MKSDIREGTITLEEGKFFLRIMKSLIKDNGALHNYDLETTECGCCEHSILRI